MCGRNPYRLEWRDLALKYQYFQTCKTPTWWGHCHNIHRHQSTWMDNCYNGNSKHVYIVLYYVVCHNYHRCTVSRFDLAEELVAGIVMKKFSQGGKYLGWVYPEHCTKEHFSSVQNASNKETSLRVAIAKESFWLMPSQCP